MGKRYSVEQKAAAVRQFADVRPGHPSDRSALRAVADEFGVPRGTLSRWVFDPRNAEASGRAGRPGRHHSPDTQAEALRRYAEVRPDHPSDRSAQRAVAAERGIGYSAVRNWVDASRDVDNVVVRRRGMGISAVMSLALQRVLNQGTRFTVHDAAVERDIAALTRRVVKGHRRVDLEWGGPGRFARSYALRAVAAGPGGGVGRTPVGVCSAVPTSLCRPRPRRYRPMPHHSVT